MESLTVAPPAAVVPGPEATANRRPQALEVFGVVGFAVLSVLLLGRVVTEPGASMLVLVGMALLGYVLSDLFSGLVHWGFDTWGSPSTPFLGPNFIQLFRVHHDDPQDITRHGFIATNGNNCLVTMPVLVVGLLLPAGSTSARVLLVSLCLGVFGTNQFHKWAHADRVSPFVAWLQRWHLILPVDHHDVHHGYPYMGHYCITSGWLNGLLDRIGFFRGLERLISAMTGARPRESDLALVSHGPEV
jgi:ubiquitin-conjugating enzyme E2 variant